MVAQESMVPGYQQHWISDLSGLMGPHLTLLDGDSVWSFLLTWLHPQGMDELGKICMTNVRFSF